MIASNTKYILQFLFSIHFHLVVLFLILTNASGSTNEIYQYFAAYLLLVLLSFSLISYETGVLNEHNTLKKAFNALWMFCLFVVLLVGFVWFFYTEGRTDLYGVVVYAGVFTVAQYFFERYALHVERKPLQSIVLHPLVGLSVFPAWIFLVDVFGVDEYTSVAIVTALFAVLYIWNAFIFLLMELISKKILIALFFPLFLSIIPYVVLEFIGSL